MRKLATIFTFFMLLGSVVMAMDESQCPPAPKTSPSLEEIKSLAGKWTGTTTHKDGKSESVVVEYHVTSGGSAVLETLSPGTPHEMVSVYHDKGGKLVMTHYCMLGNQPEMALQKNENGVLEFSATPGSETAFAGQMRMNSLVLDTGRPGLLVQTWMAVSTDGKPMDATILSLKKAS